MIDLSELADDSNAQPNSSSAFVPSPQQQAVSEWVRDSTGSAFVEAVAGSGKTTVLIQSCHHMEGSIAFTAFNRKIVEEIQSKIRPINPRARVSTFHSFGLSAWRNAAPQVVVDEHQKKRQMHEEIRCPWNLRAAVARMVSIGKQSMVGKICAIDNAEYWQQVIDHYDIMLRVDDDNRLERIVREQLIDLAVEGIEWSRYVGKTLIDFDDMIWLPLLEDAPIQTHDWVLADEAQDTNTARRLMAERLSKGVSNGRLLFCGDRFQAIYAFTGADSNAVDQIIDHFHCTSLPLTVTFRCSKEATKFAQQWVPHIEAHESNLEGSVTRMPIYSFLNNLGSLRAGEDVILCRNTKPLIKLAFQMIREGVACHVEGRDIGNQLGRLASKWRVDRCSELAGKLQEYRTREIEKLIARDAGHLVESVNDRVDSLFAIMEGCQTVEEVLAKINQMFQDSVDGRSRTVALSTIHRAKGREWDRVFILGFGLYMPSKMARQEWELTQERNLMYVAATRARRDLVLVEMVDDGELE